MLQLLLLMSLGSKGMVVHCEWNRELVLVYSCLPGERKLSLPMNKYKIAF